MKRNVECGCGMNMSYKRAVKYVQYVCNCLFTRCSLGKKIICHAIDHPKLRNDRLTLVVIKNKLCYLQSEM